MPTKARRLHVVLEPRLYAMVRAAAKLNGTTTSTAARDLIRAAVEDVDALGLGVMAAGRLRAAPTRWLSQAEVWKP